MDRIQVDTSQNVALDFTTAGVGDRILAALIDYAILTAYVIGMVMLIGAFSADVGPPPGAVILGLLSLPVLFYFLVSEIFLDGQSIGKRYMEIKVVRLDGTPPTLGSYVIRWLLRPIDILLVNGLVAILSILVTRNGQRLGDLAAGTTVVKLRRETSLDDTIYAAVDDDYVPTFADAHRLSDDDVRTAKRVLRVLQSGRANGALGPKTKAALERALGITSDLAPAAFIETVIRDYNATTQ